MMQQRGDAPVYVVTGAASGIGRATVGLLAAGAVVWALDRDPRSASELTGIPGVSFAEVDVSDEADVARAVSMIAQESGRIDGVVACAGICQVASLADTTWGLWNDTLATNLSGAYLLIREAHPHLARSGRGSFVAVASELGVVGQPNLAAYSASKAGVIGLTRALALELAPDVRCNVVAPGPIATGMLEGFQRHRGQPLVEAASGVPLGRVGEPNEVAELIRFLLEPSSSFITGAVYLIDGGLTAQ